ncbi:MAG: Oar protein [Lysobacter sp.]|nr:MAG: Oar protein [Lysobacter sp.]
MNHSSRIRLSKLSIGLLAALAVAPAFAQSTSAGVGGQVLNADGQPVSGAEVTIVHVESGTVSRVTTDAAGRYNARGLRVGGPYKITANSDGGSQSQDDVYLNLDEVSQINIAFGADELETIQVTASGFSQVFASDKMGSGSNVTRQQIETYSSINRNLQDYVRFDPRIAQTDKSRNEISVGGQNPRYNAIRVDGISTNDAFGLESNSLPTPKQPFSLDVIDEIAVDVANYDVTISGGTGGVINAVTKSGTNEFHGSVYGIYRDNDWSGKNQNNVRPVLFDNEQTYGFTLGGPIVKDKLFFFANYEKYTGKELFVGTGASSGPVGSGASNIVNITQAQIDEVLRIANNVWGFNPGTLALPALDTEAEEYGVKIDWNISDKHRASFRYGKSEQSQANLNGFGATSLALSSYQYARDFDLETYTGALYSDWTENFSTEAKVSFRDYSAIRNPLADLPAIAVRIGGATLNLGTEENTHANVLTTETWNAFFAANLFVGDHSLKFGFDYEDNDIYNLFGRRTNGVYTFNCIRTATTPQFGAGCAQSFESGVSSRYQLFYPQGGNRDNMAAIWGIKNVGLFVQDSWVVNDNLTLTFGLRYDEPMVKNSPLYNAAASAPVGPVVAGRMTGGFGFDNSATIDGNGLLEPRVGFNYRFDGERQMQVRGGFGLFQGAAASVWLSNPYSNNGISYIDYLDSNGTNLFSPNPNAQLPVALSGGIPGRQSIDFVDPDLGQPSVWKANLAFDTELPIWGMVFGAEIVATDVKEGIFYQQLNLGAVQAVGQDGRPIYWDANGRNPTRWNNLGNSTGTVTSRAGSNNSYNDALIASPTSKGESQQLTVSLEKPFSRESDWSWQLAYTYTNAKEVSPLTSSTSSSQLGNVAIFGANEEVASRSNYEIRDRFTAAVNWKHDFFGDNTTSVGLFYEGRSGRPYSYTFDNDANGDGRNNDLLYIPAAPGDVLFGTPAEEAAFWAYLQSNEYLRSHRGQIAGRNAARGTWVNQFDLRVSQELPGFMEGHKAEIALDIANVGNLLNKDWGVIEEVGFPGMRGVVEYGGIDPGTGKYVYRFNTPDGTNIYDDRGISRWSAQISLRYKF